MGGDVKVYRVAGFALFSPDKLRKWQKFVIEVRADREEEFEELMRGLPCSKVGEVSRSSRLVIRGSNGNVLIDVDVDDVWRAWREALVVR